MRRRNAERLRNRDQVLVCDGRERWPGIVIGDPIEKAGGIYINVMLDGGELTRLLHHRQLK